MAELAISGKKSLSTINKEFQAQFPYLRLVFFSKEEWDKAQNGADRVQGLDMSLRLASARVTKPSTDEKELSIHGRTLVKNLENNFFKLYGICVQVCYKKNDRDYYTSGEQDDLSLSQLNARLEKEGAAINP